MVPDKMKSSKIFLILLISILTGEILKPPEIPTPCDLLLIRISRSPLTVQTESKLTAVNCFFVSTVQESRIPEYTIFPF